MATMVKSVEVRKSKKGNLYLCAEKDGKITLVNLIKDNKKYTPKLKEGNKYDVEFTSYNLSEDQKVVTLFNVSGI